MNIIDSLSQINKANMVTSTPGATPKHKRSKSLGDSIKVRKNCFKKFKECYVLTHRRIQMQIFHSTKM